VKPPAPNPVVLGEAAEGSRVTILDRGEPRDVVLYRRTEVTCWVRFLINGKEAEAPSPWPAGTPLAA
jgi:hypothetical protein